MKIPGAGNGSPTDADWQKVGALCLGPTKANVKPGEFAGVELLLHGPQQPEPPQLPVPRLLEAVGEPTREPRSNGSIWRRPTTTPGSSNRLRPAPRTSTFSRWARRSKATWGSRTCSRRCPTGSRRRSTSTTTSTTSNRRSAPGTARSIAPASTATAIR